MVDDLVVAHAAVSGTRLPALVPPLLAVQALPGPPELLSLPHPPLPFGVNLITLVKDVLKDERELVVKDLSGLQPVIGRSGAPVVL